MYCRRIVCTIYVFWYCGTDRVGSLCLRGGPDPVAFAGGGAAAIDAGGGASTGAAATEGAGTAAAAGGFARPPLFPGVYTRQVSLSPSPPPP